MTTTTQNITIPARGFDLPATLVIPAAMAEQSTAPRTALIMLHDYFGIDDFTTRTAQRLAQNGHLVLIPDLFARVGGAPSGDDETALHDFTFALSDTQLANDVLATVQYLSGDAQTQIGIIGWGWSGAIALLAAAHDSCVAAVANIGGDLVYPVSTPQKPGSPLNFVGGIEGAIFAAYPSDVPQISRNEIDRLRRQMTDHDRRGEIKIYEGVPDRFWRDDNLPQSKILWQRLEAFLEQSFAAPEIMSHDYPNEESRLHA